MARSRIEDAIKGRAIVAAAYLVAWLPIRLGRSLGALIGWLHFALHSRTSHVTRTNLELCMPHLDQVARERLVRASLMHTGQTLMETPNIWFSGSARNLARIRRVVDEDLLHEAIDRGKGLVLLLPHLGNWEIVNHYLGSGPGMTALYAPPDLPAVDALMKRARGGVGNEVVPPTRQGLTRLYRVLEEGGIVVILPDQVPASGEFAPLFGVEALTDLLLPRLVARTGAAQLCIYVQRVSGGMFDILFKPVAPGIDDADPRRAASAVNASIEACVEACPEQYQWEYKRFKVRPPGEPRLYR